MSAESSIHYGAASTFYSASKMNTFEDSVDHSQPFAHGLPQLPKNKNKNENKNKINNTTEPSTYNSSSKNIKFTHTTSVTNNDGDDLRIIDRDECEDNCNTSSNNY